MWDFMVNLLKFLLVSFPFFAFSENIGLCIMATGKYLKYAENLIESANDFFFIDDNVKYFIFTDQDITKIDSKIIKIEQPRLGWPFDALMRFSIYLKNKELFDNQDYLFSIDADMLFVDYVGKEILADSVATLHPGYVGKTGTYEKNTNSTAYVNKRKANYYFAGAFWGGSKETFIKICDINSNNIKKDLNKSIIALWHDESHLNRYFFDNNPSKILSIDYCFPDNRKSDHPKKILALTKDHYEMRR